MKIQCTKYQWDSDTDDIDVNFYSSVSPTQLETVDLRYFFIKDSMSYKKFSFEEIDEQNTLYGKYSNYSFNAYLLSPFSEGNGVNLIDYFELFQSNKYIKWKVKYYDDNNNLLHRGFIYRDGINIDEISNGVLTIIVLSEDREFKEFFSNKKIINTDTFVFTESGYAGLKYIDLATVLYRNFPNVLFDIQIPNFTAKYFMVLNPYTFAPSNDPGWGVGNTIHIRTGYNCFLLDSLDRINFLDSLLLPRGWIWFFYNGKLVIQERAAVDYDVLEIDYRTAQVSQSVTHNWEQFQVDNIMIDSGAYFGHMAFGQPREYFSYNHRVNFVYSTTNEYLNVVRPFNAIALVGSLYSIDNFTNGHFNSYLLDENKFYIRDYQVQWISNSISSNSVGISYDTPKTLKLTPYVCSETSAGGFDFNHARVSPVNGNFLNGGRQLSDSMFCYQGTVAESVFTIMDYTGRYQNYEAYAQTNTFKRNFTKFLKTNDNVIFQMNVKQVITNPLQLIKIKNYPYADIEGKLFSILELEYDDLKNKDSNLTLQMIPDEL